MSDATPASNGPDGRDSRGKFAIGNRHGRGNPAVRRLASLQRAVRGAIGPADLRAVLRKLRDLATAGDVGAASVLLARVLGKLREPGPEVSIDLGDLATADGCATAAQRIATAVARGELPADAGLRLAELVQRAADAGALREIEARLTTLETKR